MHHIICYMMYAWQCYISWPYSVKRDFLHIYKCRSFWNDWHPTTIHWPVPSEHTVSFQITFAELEKEQRKWQWLLTTWIKTLVCELTQYRRMCFCRYVSSAIISQGAVMRSCAWRGRGGGGDQFDWVQLDSMFKKRTEAEPEAHWHCHYSDSADGMSWEEWRN